MPPKNKGHKLDPSQFGFAYSTEDLVRNQVEEARERRLKKGQDFNKKSSGDFSSFRGKTTPNNNGFKSDKPSFDFGSWRSGQYDNPNTEEPNGVKSLPDRDSGGFGSALSKLDPKPQFDLADFRSRQPMSMSEQKPQFDFENWRSGQYTNKQVNSAVTDKDKPKPDLSNWRSSGTVSTPTNDPSEFTVVSHRKHGNTKPLTNQAKFDLSNWRTGR